MWGGAVPNAARISAGLVSALHDSAGRVTLPGFYDRVRALSPLEKASIDAQPFDEAQFRRDAGDVGYLEGESGFTSLERVGVRPTAEVVGLHSGYGGPGIKTIVPATAGLKVAFRLVPDQSPDEVGPMFSQWLAERLPPGVTADVTPEGSVSPALTPVDHPAMGALSRAIEAVWGLPPLFTREGGSGPEEALGRVLDAPVLFLGVGLPGDRIHAPNERMVMEQFWKGLLAAGELLMPTRRPVIRWRGSRPSASPRGTSPLRKRRSRGPRAPVTSRAGHLGGDAPEVGGGVPSGRRSRMDLIRRRGRAANLDVRRDVPSVVVALSVRLRLPGGVDRTGGRARTGLLFLRGALHRRRGRRAGRAAAASLDADDWQFASRARRGGAIRIEATAPGSPAS